MTPLERLGEQLLVVRAQTGDPAALGELFRRYDAAVRAFVRGLVHGAADADDVVQDVWTTVCRKLGGLRDAAALRPWLFRVARNAAYETLRRRWRWEPLVDEPIEDAATDEAAEPWTADEIHAAIAGLSPEHREVLLLRLVQGLEYAEIALVIGKPIGTVRSRLHYARSALRATLEDPRRQCGRCQSGAAQEEPG